jgi:hypothetical protein
VPLDQLHDLGLDHLHRVVLQPNLGPVGILVPVQPQADNEPDAQGQGQGQGLANQHAHQVPAQPIVPPQMLVEDGEDEDDGDDEMEN